MSRPGPELPSHVRPVDAVAAVREHPEWYFRSGRFDTNEVVALLSLEALAHGSSDLLVQNFGDWWVLVSSGDWLAGDVNPFFAATPDPVRGPNTSRVEVLLSAFCRAVSTAAAGRRFNVAGNTSLPDHAEAVLEDSRCGRVIAFLPPNDVEAAAVGSSSASRHLKLVPNGDLSASYDGLIKSLPAKFAKMREGRTDR
jgi:hypothetical protein